MYKFKQHKYDEQNLYRYLPVELESMRLVLDEMNAFTADHIIISGSRMCAFFYDHLDPYVVRDSDVDIYIHPDEMEMMKELFEKNELDLELVEHVETIYSRCTHIEAIYECGLVSFIVSNENTPLYCMIDQFDLPPCKVFFDGESVYANRRLDPGIRTFCLRTYTGKRVKKYEDRGFTFKTCETNYSHDPDLIIKIKDGTMFSFDFVQIINRSPFLEEVYRLRRDETEPFILSYNYAISKDIAQSLFDSLVFHRTVEIHCLSQLSEYDTFHKYFMIEDPWLSFRLAW